MKNKTVFACEGKNDALFLGQILVEKLGYYNEDISVYSTEQKKKKGQSAEIVKFIAPHSPDIIKCFLIKDEGGKAGVKAFLNQHITPTFLGKKQLILIAILDSDTARPPQYNDDGYKKYAEGFISEIKKTFSQSRPNIKFTRKKLQIVEDVSIQPIKVEVETGSKSSFEFHIIFFKKTFEQLAGIRKEDPPEKKKEKISRYVQKSNFHELLKNLGIRQKKKRI